MSDKQILESMVGKTIAAVMVNESIEGDSVSSCVILFTDGLTIDIGCTSYNYGAQNLTVGGGENG